MEKVTKVVGIYRGRHVCILFLRLLRACKIMSVRSEASLVVSRKNFLFLGFNGNNNVGGHGHNFLLSRLYSLLNPNIVCKSQDTDAYLYKFIIDKALGLLITSSSFSMAKCIPTQFMYIKVSINLSNYQFRANQHKDLNKSWYKLRSN